MRYAIVFAALLAAVCLAQTDCQPVIEFPDGSSWKYDLTGLWHDAGQPDKISANDEDLNKYFINVCGEVTTANTQECKGASVCQETLADDHNNAGSLKSQTFFASNDTEPGKGIMVKYSNGDKCSNGDPRTTTISITCDPYCDDPLIDMVKEVAHCSYSVHITSKYGCGESVSGGGGDTAALVILLILIIGFILYFVIGAIYQKKVKDAANLREMIIHNEFWCALPSLVKDGVMFIFHCCKKGDYLSV